MARFRGSSEHSIDSKGRLAVPAKMRAAKELKTGHALIATIGLDGCIMLYPEDAWERKEDEMEAQNQYRPEVRDALRVLVSNAEDAEIDGQGRIALSKKHLDYAGLTPSSTALVLGMLDHMEVWSPALYHARINEKSADAETLVERVMGGGL